MQHTPVMVGHSLEDSSQKTDKTKKHNNNTPGEDVLINFILIHLYQILFWFMTGNVVMLMYVVKKQQKIIKWYQEFFDKEHRL